MKFYSNQIKKIKTIASYLAFLFGCGCLVSLIVLIWGGGSVAAKLILTFALLWGVANIFKNI